MKTRIISFLLFFIPVLLSRAQENTLKHVVKQGETIYSIARKYKTTPYKIIKYNPGLDDTIKPGQTLIIPVTESVLDTLKKAGYAGFKYHTVKENETLFSISKQYNTSIEDIIRVNKIEENNIKLGQVIIIPIHPDPFKQLDTTRYTVYTVKPKEGKWRVAYNHGITVEELERLNPEIKGKPLQLNQKLIVPKINAETRSEEEKKYIFYEVKPLETIYSLSKRFNISQEDLVKYNPELAEGLKAGQVIKIPRETQQPKEEEKFSSRYFYHKVKPKETLWRISKRYNISFEELMKHNPELKDGLKAGQIIRIPKPEFEIVFDPSSPLFFRIVRPVKPGEYTVNLIENMNKNRTYKFAVLLPLNVGENLQAECNTLLGRKIYDYYAGVKAAVDTLREMGLQVEMNVFDTRASVTETERILLNKDLSDYDFVFGPVFPQNIVKTADALSMFNTPVTVPFLKDKKGFPNLVRTVPDSTALADHMIAYLQEIKTPDDEYILVYDSDSEETMKKVASSLGTINTLKANRKKGKNWIKDYQLNSRLSPSRHNRVVLVTKDLSLVANSISLLDGLSDKYDISVYSLADIKNFKTLDVKKMSAIRFHFPSPDLKIPDARLSKYVKNKYGLLPTGTFINGFDTTFDLLIRLANAENLYEGLKKFGKTQESSRIYMYGFDPTTGFTNRASFILQITPEMEIEKVD